MNYTKGAGEMQPEHGTKEESHPFMIQVKCSENKEDAFHPKGSAEEGHHSSKAQKF